MPIYLSKLIKAKAVQLFHKYVINNTLLWMQISRINHVLGYILTDLSFNEIDQYYFVLLLLLSLPTWLFSAWVTKNCYYVRTINQSRQQNKTLTLLYVELFTLLQKS